MKILSFCFLLLTGLGFGYGVDELTGLDELQKDDQYNYENTFYSFCHEEGYFFEHLIEGLSEQDRQLVEDKIDELLLKYEITEEELTSGFEMYTAFMIELMDFLDDNDIVYHNHIEENDWHHGMGMR